MTRLVQLLIVAVATALISGACAGSEALEPVAVDENGFPLDWPIEIPPGTVTNCGNGQVMQEDVFFSVVVCLPNDPDPFTVSEHYLAALEGNGFIEREPGAFITNQETFLDGNGIEIYYQLVAEEATIVLIKPAS